MSVKLALLKSGETLITDVKELVTEETAVSYTHLRAHET